MKGKARRRVGVEVCGDGRWGAPRDRLRPPIRISPSRPTSLPRSNTPHIQPYVHRKVTVQTKRSHMRRYKILSSDRPAPSRGRKASCSRSRRSGSSHTCSKEGDARLQETRSDRSSLRLANGNERERRTRPGFHISPTTPCTRPCSATSTDPSRESCTSQQSVKSKSELWNVYD